MALIRVDLPSTICDGQTVTFRSPTSCSDVTGLKVYYREQGQEKFRVFQFADAHGNNVGGVDLFASGVLVRVILDTALSRAYVKNSDTNAYLEGKLQEVEQRFNSHGHSANQISGGTFGGPVIASSSSVAQPAHVYVIRNQKLSATEEVPTVNGSICWQYE